MHSTLYESRNLLRDQHAADKHEQVAGTHMYGPARTTACTHRRKLQYIRQGIWLCLVVKQSFEESPCWGW